MPPAMSGARLLLENLTVYRTQDDASVQPVIRELSLEVEPGCCCMLVGPNGAGKTSLLLALVGALPFTGEIRMGDLVLTADTLREVRQRVGFVFANPDEQLFCETVNDEVGFGPKQRGLDALQVQTRTNRALDQVDLRQHADRHPHRLSLGQQRRVAIAAALATEPEAVLFDEPTASLDPLARRTILSAMRAARATLLVASHDLEAALELDAAVALLNDGSLVGAGPAARVLTDQALLVQAGLRLPTELA